jgi:hypothetical protein
MLPAFGPERGLPHINQLIVRLLSLKSGYVNVLTRSSRQLLQILGAVLSVSDQARYVILLTARTRYLNLLTWCSDRENSLTCGAGLLRSHYVRGHVRAFARSDK